VGGVPVGVRCGGRRMGLKNLRSTEKRVRLRSLPPKAFRILLQLWNCLSKKFRDRIYAWNFAGFSFLVACSPSRSSFFQKILRFGISGRLLEIGRLDLVARIKVCWPPTAFKSLSFSQRGQ
jgi:hypothetical protein